MKTYRGKLIRIAAVGIMAVILFLATIGVARTAYAQDNNGNPSILQALQAIQNTLASLGSNTLPSIGTALVSFQNAVSPPSQENVRFTPPVRPSVADFVTCEVVNVISETRMLRLQLIDALGTVRQDDTISVGAGNARQLRGLAAVDSVVVPVYCKFTVVDGLRSDIRGAVEIFPMAAPGGDKLAVPAE